MPQFKDLKTVCVTAVRLFWRQFQLWMRNAAFFLLGNKGPKWVSSIYTSEGNNENNITEPANGRTPMTYLMFSVKNWSCQETRAVLRSSGAHVVWHGAGILSGPDVSFWFGLRSLGRLPWRMWHSLRLHGFSAQSRQDLIIKIWQPWWGSTLYVYPYPSFGWREWKWKKSVT